VVAAAETRGTKYRAIIDPAIRSPHIPIPDTLSPAPPDVPLDILRGGIMAHGAYIAVESTMSKNDKYAR